ncbi:hypothetical protein F4774DRAFT_386262 [Daldinia eschscholtzii]|nr:hypothetical protein F4774DRAFT_386262 [Daldinia eschscholtzii]
MASTTPGTPLGLLDLPTDILVMLPDFLHNIEDYVNLSSTCRSLRKCMHNASPRTILRLAHASSRVFFRPDPLFLICATARELGNWARESEDNEAELVAGMPRGLDHLMDMALRHCGLTVARIRELHALHFAVVNPVSNIIDQCVGTQWYATPHFWDGGVDDAYTVDVDPNELIFDLAIYGELFAPDLEHLFNNTSDDPAAVSSRRRLKLATRLEYIKYCLPDDWIICKNKEPGSYDPRLELVHHPEGPWVRVEGERNRSSYNHTVGLIWLMNSSRWKPHWVKAREAAGAGPEFNDRFCEDHLDFTHMDPANWKQLLLTNVMQNQGLEGLGMILGGTEIAERFKPKIREWKDKIERMEMPPKTMVGRCEAYDYPDLWGDLHVCRDGYVLNT